MNFKTIKDQSGNVVAYGPNDKNYAPTIPAGCYLDLTDKEPLPTTAQMWAKIKSTREHLSDTGGYKVAIGGVDKWFHSDAKSKTQQLGLLRQADRVEAAAGNMNAPFPGPGPGGVLPWKTMDGSYVVMTAAIAQAVFGAAEAQDKAIYATAEAHQAAMLAAPDPAAYDFSGGWPAVFVPA